MPPQSQQPLKNRSERESGDHVARPVRQNHYARKGKTDGNRLDRPAGYRGQCTGGRSERAHMQRVARRKGVVTLAGKRTPCRCPTTVRRSGRVWSNTAFRPCGSNDAAIVTNRAWLPARRSTSLRPREASQPAAARAKRTFSSAPHVRARAIASGAGFVLRVMAFAIAMSAPVGRTVTGTVFLRWRQIRWFRGLAAVCMTSSH